ncbi:tetratricopeptide repeat protein [Campylobacter pinnipediorum]|uniref:tetratricopeptide repeat protein n=1 Tax=Campylobacter pinnipediorum TaxID=1965231 RepID=UPI00084DD3BB|nr:tetratricopeptide repeat protein [Campylobacter pinnipediorum]
MKKILFLVFVFLFLNGCGSLQKTLSFGYLKNNKDIVYEHLLSKCNQKDAISCNNLGVNYTKDEDFKQAKHFYKVACDLKLATACSNLGQIYEKGLDGKSPDFKKAMNLYSYACQNNDGVGCYNESIALYGFSKYYDQEYNLKKSMFLLKKSCKLEYKQACLLLEQLKN